MDEQDRLSQPRPAGPAAGVDDPFEPAAGPGGSTGFEPRDGRGALRLLPWCLLLLMLGGAALTFTRCSGPDEARVAVGGMTPRGRRVSEVSTQTSERFRDNLDEWSAGRAREAMEQGKSFVAPAASPRVTPQTRPEPAPEPEPEPVVVGAPPAPRPRPALSRPREQPREPKADPRVTACLQSLMQDRRAAPRGLTVVLNSPSAPSAAPSRTARTAQDTGLPRGLRAGDILYAVNRVTLDSDQPGPALAEIISGPWRGARVIGSFQRLGQRLVLQFRELVTTDGQSVAIDAWAIDPATDRSAVASHVDSHLLERWGGIIAASFLEGFGDAVSRSGTSSYGGVYGSGWSAPEYSLGDETWIAAGKVGGRVAKHMEQAFDTPPTVVLESGTDIGVLVLRQRDRTRQQTAPQTVVIDAANR